MSRVQVDNESESKAETSATAWKLKPCADRVDFIHRFLDGEVHSREKISLEEHFESCVGCDTYRAEIGKWVTATSELFTQGDDDEDSPKKGLVKAGKTQGKSQPKTLKSPITKRRVYDGVDRQMRVQVAERLCDLAKARIARALVPAIHASTTTQTVGATVRRIQDLISQRNDLGALKRSIRGPWADLKEISAKSESTEDATELIEGGMEHLERALEFSSGSSSLGSSQSANGPDSGTNSGRASLLLATYARVLGDDERAWKEASAAARGSDVKVRCAAHIALAHLFGGIEDFDNAKAHFERARVYDESSPWPLYGLALVAFCQGATRDARRRLDVLQSSLEKMRKPEEFQRSLRSFLDRDSSALSETRGIGRLRATHFARLVNQAIEDLPKSDLESQATLYSPVDGLGPWEVI